MYYILNQTNRIIAIDDELLRSLSVESIDELHHNIAHDKIDFNSFEDGKLDIKTEEGLTSYNSSSRKLSTLLGDMTLVEVDKAIQKDIDIKATSNSFDTTMAGCIKDILDEEKENITEPEASENKEEPLLLEETIELEEDNSEVETELAIEETLSEVKIEEEDLLSLNDEINNKERSDKIQKEKEDDFLTIGSDTPLVNVKDDTLSLLDDSFTDESNLEDIIKEESSESNIFDNDKLFDIMADDDIKEEVAKVDEISLDDNDDLFDIKSDDDIEEDIAKVDEISLDDNDDLFDIKSDDEISLDDNDDLFDIKSDDEISLDDNDDLFDIKSDDEISLEDIEVDEVKYTPLIINLTQASKDIGITEDDYNNFLNEYVDTSLKLENDLKSNQSSKISNAVNTLSNLANVLHLPSIKSILENIEKSDGNKQGKYIGLLYQTLVNLTIEKTEPVKTPDVVVTVPKVEVKIEKEPEIVPEPVVEPKIELPVEVKEEVKIELEPEIELVPEVQEPVEEELSTKGFGVVDLSEVQPIHFDFQLEAAANELSLPVELIEEFVVDFIEQAKEETEKMLEAHKKGDLDTIQKIGHLLKGTSSNLRINPLADTLYKIQFCEDPAQLDSLIKEYWAHFLSFEKKISMITK